MADITLCNNLRCPLADKCKRAQATPSEHWQSYSAWECTEKDGVILCDGFYPIKELTPTLDLV